MGRMSLITTVALAAALAVPATSAARPYEELRAQDNATGLAQQAPPPSSIAAGEGSTYQDLRSPDARDAALAGRTGRGTGERELVLPGPALAGRA